MEKALLIIISFFYIKLTNREIYVEFGNISLQPSEALK